MQLSCNVKKSTKTFTWIFGFFYCTAYSHVFAQQTPIQKYLKNIQNEIMSKDLNLF